MLQFQERCFQTCSLLQGLNRHQECLKWIGEILSFEALDKSQMQYLVCIYIYIYVCVCVFFLPITNCVKHTTSNKK